MMKPAMSFPLISVLLVFSAISAPDAVFGNPLDSNPLDSANNELRPGVPYYILPAEDGAGGGLYPENLLSNTPHVSCPLDRIFKSIDPFHKGVPVMFSPWNASLEVVPLNQNLNIYFSSDLWFCPESKVWTANYSASQRGFVVITGGTFCASDSWFKIERDGNAHKLVYSSGLPPSNRDVGIFTFGPYTRYLILSDKPFAVKFQKASLTNPTEKAMLRMFPSY